MNLFGCHIFWFYWGYPPVFLLWPFYSVQLKFYGQNNDGLIYNRSFNRLSNHFLLTWLKSYLNITRMDCSISIRSNGIDETTETLGVHRNSGLQAAINLNCIKFFDSRSEGGIDAGVGARVAWDEGVTTIDDTFTGNGEIAQSVDIISRAWIIRLLRQTANTRSEVNWICVTCQLNSWSR